MSNQPPKVYIAGPYSSDPETNTKVAIMTWHAVTDMGAIPYVPHLAHYLDAARSRDYEEWMQHCLQWVDVCDALYRIPGESPGSDREIQHALQKDIPVFYELDELEQFVKTGFQLLCMTDVLKRPPVKIEIEDDELSIEFVYYGNTKTYGPIALERINTPEKLLVWIMHLNQKTWCDHRVTEPLIETVCQHFGWSLPYGC